MTMFVYLLILASLALILVPNSYGQESSECKFEDQDIEELSCVTVSAKDQTKTFKSFRNFNSTMYAKNIESGERPHNWYTGIMLQRIGKVDTVAGTYELNFNYWVQIFDSKDPANFTKNPPKLDFLNAIEDPVVELTKGRIQKDHYYDVQASGKFFTSMNFKKFPFEELNLHMQVEPEYIYPQGNQNNTIQLHIWPYPGLANGTISPGYYIKSYKINASDVRIDVGNTYSRYEISFDVQRHIFSSFLKYIFPILVMTGLSIAALFFPSEEYLTKIELNAIFLLGILFFVQVVVDDVPTVEDMTIFDHIVIMCISIIIVTILTPAAKWKRRREYEKIKEALDDRLVTIKRNYDLLLEERKRIDSRLLYLAITHQPLEEQSEDIKQEIEALDKKRTATDNKIENDPEYVIWEVDKERTDIKYDELKKTYPKYNAIAGFLISLIVVTEFIFILLT